MTYRAWICERCRAPQRFRENIWDCPGCNKEGCDDCFDRYAHCKECAVGKTDEQLRLAANANGFKFEPIEESLQPAPPTGTAQEQAEAYAGAPNAVIGLSSRRVAIDAWLAGHQAALTATAAPPSREAQLQACVDAIADADKAYENFMRGNGLNCIGEMSTYWREVDRLNAQMVEAKQAARRLRSAEGTKG